MLFPFLAATIVGATPKFGHGSVKFSWRLGKEYRITLNFFNLPHINSGGKADEVRYQVRYHPGRSMPKEKPLGNLRLITHQAVVMLFS